MYREKGGEIYSVILFAHPKRPYIAFTWYIVYSYYIIISHYLYRKLIIKKGGEIYSVILFSPIQNAHTSLSHGILYIAIIESYLIIYTGNQL